MQDIYNSFQAIGKDMAVSTGRVNFRTADPVTKGNALGIYNGKFRLASNTLARPAVAIALASAAANELVPAVLLHGYADGFTGLTANATYYVGAAGAIVTPKPGGAFVQAIGFALSTTELMVNISQPV